MSKTYSEFLNGTELDEGFKQHAAAALIAAGLVGGGGAVSNKLSSANHDYQHSEIKAHTNLALKAHSVGDFSGEHRHMDIAKQHMKDLGPEDHAMHRAEYSKHLKLALHAQSIGDNEGADHHKEIFKSHGRKLGLNESALLEWPQSGPVSHDAARELHLHAVNVRELADKKEPFLLNIQRKIKRGVYDHSKAPKLWQYYVDEVARHYVKHHDAADAKVSDVFNKNTRQHVAKQMADDEYDNITSGEYSHLLGK